MREGDMDKDCQTGCHVHGQGNHMLLLGCNFLYILCIDPMGFQGNNKAQSLTQKVLAVMKLTYHSPLWTKIKEFHTPLVYVVIYGIGCKLYVLKNITMSKTHNVKCQ